MSSEGTEANAPGEGTDENPPSPARSVEGKGGRGPRSGRGGGRGRGRGRGSGRGPGRGSKPKMCYNCGKVGHIADDCPEERAQGEARQEINKARTKYRRCFNCGRVGHISADCLKPPGNKSCYNCGQEGHIARECPNPRQNTFVTEGSDPGPTGEM